MTGVLIWEIPEIGSKDKGRRGVSRTQLPAELQSLLSEEAREVLTGALCLGSAFGNYGEHTGEKGGLR